MDLRHEVANLTNAVLDVGTRIGERNYLYALVSKDGLGGRAPETFVGGQVRISLREPGQVFGNIGIHATPHWNPGLPAQQAAPMEAQTSTSKCEQIRRPRASPPRRSSADGNDSEYEVEGILDSKFSDDPFCDLYYRIECTGSVKSTWRPATDLGHCKDVVREFHEKNPKRPGSYKHFLLYVNHDC